MSTNMTKNKKIRPKHYKANRNRILFYLLSMITVCFLTMIMVFSHSLMTNANERRSSGDRIYSSILIKDGDTLWSIADEYKPDEVSTKAYIQSLKDINQIKSDMITSGNYLIVYDYAD